MHSAFHTKLNQKSESALFIITHTDFHWDEFLSQFCWTPGSRLHSDWIELQKNKKKTKQKTESATPPHVHICPLSWGPALTAGSETHAERFAFCQGNNQSEGCSLFVWEGNTEGDECEATKTHTNLWPEQQQIMCDSNNDGKLDSQIVDLISPFRTLSVIHRAVQRS